MTKAEKLLAEAIKEGDWEKARLAQEAISAAKAPRKRATPSKTKAKAVAVADVEAPVRKKKGKTLLNVFEDDGTVAPELIEESKTQPRKEKQRRAPSGLTNFTCSRCGKQQQLPASYPVFGAFVCDGCGPKR